MSRYSLKDWVISNPSSNPNLSVLLMDGGVSTHLENLLQQNHQAAVFAHRELWSSSLLLTEAGRSLIQRGHHDWMDVGCDIITTVTYQCHFGVYLNSNEKPHLPSPTVVVNESTMTKLMKDGLQLAKESAAKHRRNAYVVVSSGCYGAALADGSEYTGVYPNVNQAKLTAFHRAKCLVYLQENPDGLAIETIPSLDECASVCAALKMMPKNSTCCWLSFACNDGKHLNDGTLFEAALNLIHEMDPNARLIHAIGLNCFDSNNLKSLVTVLVRCLARHKAAKRGIVLYPNSGEEWDDRSATWRAGTGCTDNEEFSSRLLEALNVIKSLWIETTGSIEDLPRIVLGGCCRTTPNQIHALRQKVDKWQQKIT